MKEQPSAAAAYALDQCRCVIDAGCLRLVRRHSMVSLEAVTASSPFPREYLAGVERGEEGKSAEAKVVRAYKRAVGAKLDTVLGMHNSVLPSLAIMHNWLTQLHLAREKQQL